MIQPPSRNVLTTMRFVTLHLHLHSGGPVRRAPLAMRMPLRSSSLYLSSCPHLLKTGKLGWRRRNWFPKDAAKDKQERRDRKSLTVISPWFRPSARGRGAAENLSRRPVLRRFRRTPPPARPHRGRSCRPRSLLPFLQRQLRFLGRFVGQAEVVRDLLLDLLLLHAGQLALREGEPVDGEVDHARVS